VEHWNKLDRREGAAPSATAAAGARTSCVGRPDQVIVGAVTLQYRAANARGWAVGQHSPKARHDDLAVRAARERHAAGERVADIARGAGIARTTVSSWVNLRRRNTPVARTIVVCLPAHTVCLSVSSQAAKRLPEEATENLRPNLRATPSHPQKDQP